MLYLGIDLHRKQMTVSLRNEHGDVVLRRQVSNRWKKVEEFSTIFVERTPTNGTATNHEKRSRKASAWNVRNAQETVPENIGKSPGATY